MCVKRFECQRIIQKIHPLPYLNSKLKLRLGAYLVTVPCVQIAKLCVT